MKSKYFLALIIATVITIIAWAVADLIHSRSQVEIPPETQQLLQPLDTNFNTQVLNEL